MNAPLAQYPAPFLSKIAFKVLLTVFVCLVILAGMSASSYADDTDIFFPSNGAFTGENVVKPNLLFVMDNSGSMADPLGAELSEYDSAITYDQVQNGGVSFDRDSLYFQAQGETSWQKISSQLNVCAALEESAGFLEDSFSGLLAVSSTVVSGDGWEKLTSDRSVEVGSHTGTVVVSPASPQDCNSPSWQSVSESSLKNRLIQTNDNDSWNGGYKYKLPDDLKVNYTRSSNENFWNNSTNQREWLPWWSGSYSATLDPGDYMLLTGENYKIKTCLPATPEVTGEVQISDYGYGDWRAVECLIDAGIHGREFGSALKHIKLFSGNDLNVSSAAAADSPEVESWFSSTSASGAEDRFAAGKLGYGNYWNWWFNPKEGNQGQTVNLTRLEGAQQAFRSIVANAEGKRIGIMKFQVGTYDMGVVDYPVVDVDVATNENNLLSSADALIANGSTMLGETLFEALKYFIGEKPTWRGNNTSSNQYSNHGSSITSSSSNGKFISPITSSCQKNHVVIMTDGAPQNDHNNADDIEDDLNDFKSSASSSYSCNYTYYDTPNSRGYRAPHYDGCILEVAKFFQQEDLAPSLNGTQSAQVHTVAFSGGDAAYLKDVAAAGGGSFYNADSVNELTAAFESVLNTINDQVTSAAAPSIPVSSTSRFSSGDKVYVSLFKPSMASGWNGNLKSYFLKERDVPYTYTVVSESATGSIVTSTETATKTVVKLVDSLDNDVVDSTTELIDETAISRWTNVNSPDGSDILLGGAREQMENAAKLIVSGSSDKVISSSSHFTKLDVDLFGDTSFDGSDRTQVLKWALNYNNSAKSGVGDSQMMGDPLHSSPKTLSYTQASKYNIHNTATVANTQWAPKELVFVGSNMGMLHAFNSESGEDIVRWMPEKLLPHLKKYYDLSTETSGKLYGLDGGIAIWHDDVNRDRYVNPGEKALLIIGMRRGGRDYYALDISDAHNGNISLEWKIEGGVTQGFSDLGQTWSTPIIRKINYKGSVKDVLIFSGGYDPSHDETDAGTYNFQNTLGRGVYVVDVSNGQKLWSAGINNQEHQRILSSSASMPASPVTLDVTGDSLIDVIVTVDLAGEVTRFDINNNNSEASTLNQIFNSVVEVASLKEVGSSAQNRREFYAQPAAAIVGSGSENSMSIMFGSGRRVDPRSTVIQDRYYVLRQPLLFNTGSGSSDITHASLAQVVFSDLSTNTVNSTTISESDHEKLVSNGFYVDLQGAGSLNNKGEKVLDRSTIVQGVALFPTYLPDTGGGTADEEGCVTSGLGGNRLYALDIKTGDTVQIFDIIEEGIFNAVSTIYFKGQLSINVPVIDEDAGEITLLGTSEATKGCVSGFLCLPGSTNSFVKFWVERAL